MDSPVGPLLRRYGLPPDEIEARSLARLEALVGPRLPADPLARSIALRMLYAAGDPELIERLVVSPEACARGVEALRAGRPLLVDVSMVERGLRRDLLAGLGVRAQVMVEAPGAADFARELGITRAAAGVLLLASELRDGGVVAVGNAPTALLALLDEVEAGRCAPDLLVGCPVGMVAAAESKQALAERGLPAVTILGTRGGSPLAAAALNALLAAACHDV